MISVSPDFCIFSYTDQIRSVTHKRSLRREHQEVPAITHNLLATVKERVCHLVDTGECAFIVMYGCESWTMKKAESWMKN